MQTQTTGYRNMSIFYSMKMYRQENLKHLACLFVLFLISFISLGSFVIFGLQPNQADLVWSTLRTAPVIFGTLTYVVLGISLSFLSYRSLAKIICFTAVITDGKNRKLLNALLFNLLLLNIFASAMIAGYIGIYFLNPSDLVGHILSLLQTSLIIPITYCMRILEGCIDKIVNLESDVENNCLRFVQIPH